LYFIAPEIAYEYRAINVEILGTKLKVTFFTLATKQPEPFIVDISSGINSFKIKLTQIGNLSLFKAALQFLVNQTLLKREYRGAPIKKQIIPGQAKVAVLSNGDRMNVGWIRIEGDEVVFYTGKGLYNIWRPNMSSTDQKKAEEYKKLTEEELKALGFLDRKKISEFKLIE